MANSILFDADRLEALYRELVELRDELDKEENVPERYESTLAGHLASADADHVMTTRSIVHRLMLDARHPTVERGRYTREPAGPVGRVAR